MKKYLLFLSKTFLLSFFYTFNENSDVILLLIVFLNTVDLLILARYSDRIVTFPYRTVIVHFLAVPFPLPFTS
jgi:hypothetical protein